MVIPKYIIRLISRRQSLAEELTAADMQLQEWLEKNDIVVEDYDIMGGVEMYVNPSASAARIVKAISDK